MLALRANSLPCDRESKREHTRESKVLISLSSSLFLSCSLSLLFFLRSKRVLTKEREERERACELAAACARQGESPLSKSLILSHYLIILSGFEKKSKVYSPPRFQTLYTPFLQVRGKWSTPLPSRAENRTKSGTSYTKLGRCYWIEKSSGYKRGELKLIYHCGNYQSFSTSKPCFKYINRIKPQKKAPTT